MARPAQELPPRVPASAVGVHAPGQRADLAGPLSAIFTVNFGRAPDGTHSASVSTNGPNPLRAQYNIEIPPPRKAQTVKA